MKNISKSIVVILAAGLFSGGFFSQQASATLMTGNISFSAQLEYDTGDLNTANAVTRWGTTKVQAADGSFGGIAQGTAATFGGPWNFDPSTPLAGLWSVGGFTFDLLTSSIVNQGGGFLTISGTGIITSTNQGFQPTAATWSFSQSHGQEWQIQLLVRQRCRARWWFCFSFARHWIGRDRSLASEIWSRIRRELKGGKSPEPTVLGWSSSLRLSGVPFAGWVGSKGKPAVPVLPRAVVLSIDSPARRGQASHCASGCDRAQFSPGLDSVLFREDGSFFAAGVRGGSVFEDPSLETLSPVYRRYGSHCDLRRPLARSSIREPAGLPRRRTIRTGPRR